MISAPIFMVNSVVAINVRFVAKWNGPWIAEFDLDLKSTDVIPIGLVTCTIQSQQLIGTIDPNASGRNGAKGKVRVIGGANGWSQDVPALSWTNDAGVLSTTVLTSTASAVAETVVDSAPVVFGPYYSRTAGRASRVFGARDWYVDFTGITQVASYPSAQPSDDVTILDWDPYTQILTLASDTLILPGTQFSDSTLFDGTIVVRDVEQTFSEKGSRVECLCSSKTTNRLLAVLGKMAQEATGITYARTYQYRVVEQGPDGRLDLQSIDSTSGAPDLKMTPPMYGEPGLTVKISPASVVLVSFAPDRTEPFAISYDSTSPIEVDHAAILSTFNGKIPVAMTPGVQGIANALSSFIAAVNTYAGGIAAIADPTGSNTSAISTAATAATQSINAALQEVPSMTLQAS